jgi:hypothetical protein
MDPAIEPIRSLKKARDPDERLQAISLRVLYNFFDPFNNIYLLASITSSGTIKWLK